MKSVRSWLSAMIVVAFIGSMVVPVSAVQARGAFTYGTVVALQGTPHLWFADAQGVLHWGGDTRALAGRYINWNNRVELSLEQLRAFQRGDPWLSAGLLKDGDPIYLVKWETEWSAPRLLHIQSIRDVELFGIDAGNYGAFVLERPVWSARFGFSVTGLQLATLAAATSSSPASLPPPPPGPRSHPASPESKAALVSRQAGSVGNDNDDNDDDNGDDTDTNTATATATATGDQTATATATATGTDASGSVTDDSDSDGIDTPYTTDNDGTDTPYTTDTATDTDTGTDDSD